MTKDDNNPPGLLGQTVPVPESPDVAVLDAVPNPHPGSDYLIRFTCPEFTSLCPVTGQPDFAHIVMTMHDLSIVKANLSNFYGFFPQSRPL